MTRGLRNNNPLNIRRTPTKWKGQSNTQTDPEFVQFRSMPWGIRAAFCLLQTYATKHGLRSVRQIINRWAPPTENNTKGYISHVCLISELHPDCPLEPCQWPILLQAMARIETGELLPMDVIRQGEALFQQTSTPLNPQKQ